MYVDAQSMSRMRLTLGVMETQSERSLAWVPLLAFVVALALALGVAVIALGVVSIATAARMPVAPAESAAPATRRCPECGWIESKRELPDIADEHSTRIQEFTVRMADGSSRVFTGGPAERWRLGERLKFIEGSRQE